MESKQEIASAYVNSLKKHLEKPYPAQRKISVTGAGREGSIGKTILGSLYGDYDEAEEADIDVRLPLSAGWFSEYNCLVMCHGVTHLDWLEDAPAEKVKEICDVNLYGTINTVHNFVRDTIGSPFRKKIVSIGSMAYNKVLNGSSAYCASKAGAAHFMRCAAWELAPKGYDVYSIHPSNVDDTPMSKDTIEGLKRYRGISQEEAEAYWSDTYIRGRSLSKFEIPGLVDFLLSPAAEFLSGQQFEMTGGQR